MLSQRAPRRGSHAALGDPSTDFTALLERKARLLLTGADAPQELQDILRQRSTVAEWREVILVVIAAGFRRNQLGRSGCASGAG